MAELALHKEKAEFIRGSLSEGGGGHCHTASGSSPSRSDSRIDRKLLCPSSEVEPTERFLGWTFFIFPAKTQSPGAETEETESWSTETRGP